MRAATDGLAAPLSPEDQVVQSMPDASPTKWHLAHTSWFFETFLLAPRLPGYRVFDERFGYLFNSYYEAVGPRYPRPRRGLLSRPALGEVMAYRAHVGAAMPALLERADEALIRVVELGLAHEEQHQELILTDILHLFSRNPLEPAYRREPEPVVSPSPPGWTAHPGGRVAIGHAGPGFAFDNEGPRHDVLLRPFHIADRPVCNAEYAAFVAAGGYRRPELWLSDGWAMVQERGWRLPLYWRDERDGFSIFGLAGRRRLDPGAPACHLSYYEADAYARWAGKRLPREEEWEVAAPAAAGAVWEWTMSPYVPYPGYCPAVGALGEYNGKFMSGQMVLRGGSRATPPGHARATYRNYFPPAARWQFAGLRLAEDA